MVDLVSDDEGEVAAAPAAPKPRHVHVQQAAPPARAQAQAQVGLEQLAQQLIDMGVASGKAQASSVLRMKDGDMEAAVDFLMMNKK